VKYFINIISLVLGTRKAASTPKIIKFDRIITKYSRHYTVLSVLYRCYYSFNYRVLIYFTQKKDICSFWTSALSECIICYIPYFFYLMISEQPDTNSKTAIVFKKKNF